MKRALATGAALILALTAGCGSSGPGGAPDDAASVAPAATIAYASFALSPDGDAREGFDAAFGKLVGPDPSDRMKRALIGAIEERRGKLDYEDDVEPWLGDTVAGIVTGIRRDTPDFAVLLASKDDDKARDAIQKDLAGRNARKGEYRGTEFWRVDDTIVNGVAHHYLVAGTEAAFKAVVDAGGDGESLAETGAWKRSVGSRADGKVGLGWVDVKAGIQAVASQIGGAGGFAAPLVLSGLQINPFVATLDANADSLVVDVASPGTPADKRGVAAASSSLIEDLPSDSWAAFAAPDVGTALRKVIDGVKLNPLMAEQYRAMARELQVRTGLDLERQVLPALGDVGGFARGDSPATAGGGLVIDGGDAKALDTVVRTLPALIARDSSVRVRRRGSGFDVTSREMPKAVQVRQAAGRAVAAYGPANTRAALSPDATLGGTPLFRKARAKLGGRPTFFAVFEPIVRLAKASPHASEEKAARFQRKAARLEYAAVGARRQGRTDVLRAVLGLR